MQNYALFMHIIVKQICMENECWSNKYLVVRNIFEAFCLID